MSATPILICFTIACVVLIIIWAYQDYLNGKKERSSIETLDKTLLGLIVLLLFILGLFFAYFF